MRRIDRFRAVLAIAVILAACTETSVRVSPAPDYAEAIRAVIEQDHQLGTARNNASNNAPIARAVAKYVAGLDALDLHRCPADFVVALKRHRDAWHDSIEFFDQYAELRGELHDVFDAIRAKGETHRTMLAAIEADLWGTWEEVEKVMDAHLGKETADSQE